MFCEKCGNKTEENAKFCQKCGKAILVTLNMPLSTPVVTGDTPPIKAKSEPVVKCGNCGYVGHGESARNPVFTVLAWICVFYAPLITIIYFVATHKYRCPKCKSTFLGIKNKEGLFSDPKRGNKNPAMIFVWVLLGIAIIGILSSVILASLNSARQKARQNIEQGVGV